jgi:hypothetical protein
MQTKNLGYINGRRVKPTRGKRRRVTVESQPAICVNELHRDKAFRDFWTSFENIGLTYSTVLWLRACRQQAEIYHATPTGAQKQIVPIVWTYCAVGSRGGWRPWFRCKCGQRAGKLYNTGLAFTCRNCCNLIYERQLKSAKGRLQRTARKIRLQLSSVEQRTGKLPSRPYGMRTEKYRKLISRLSAVDARIALRGH